MKIAIIGVGNLGSSLTTGLINSKLVNPQDLLLIDKNYSKLESFVKNYGCSSELDSNSSKLSNYEYVFLAVKPQDLASLKLNEVKCIVSLMAGITIDALKKTFPGCKNFISAMPNLTASIHKSVTCYYLDPSNKRDYNNEIKIIFDAIGTSYKVIEERQITFATALYASGPAFFLYFLDSLIESTKEYNLPKELCVQMLHGVLDYYQELKSEPKEIIKKIASKGGTTEKGLEVLEKSNLAKIIKDTLEAAIKRF